MKRVILIALIVMSVFSCKKTEFEPEGPTDVRIYNNTEKAFDNVLVKIKEEEHNFGSIAPKTYSDYYRYQTAFQKVDISLTIEATQYSTVQQDYTHQIYLGQVKCTYKVFISDETNKLLDMEVVYDSPLKR